MRQLLLISTIAAFAFCSSAQAATTVGTPEGSNAIPFSSPLLFDLSIYQQLYAASAFAGPTAINTISFDFSSGIDLATADLDISFYLSPLGVGDLTETAADNRGILLSNFGSFSTSGSAPTVLSFTGSMFNYNPLEGNLLMQINYSNVTSDGFSFYARDVLGSTVTQRYYGGETGIATGGSGLVTTFSVVNAGVPEPSTWAFMIFGFGAIGGAMRRQRKANVKVCFG